MKFARRGTRATVGALRARIAVLEDECRELYGFLDVLNGAGITLNGLSVKAALAALREIGKSPHKWPETDTPKEASNG